MDLGLRWEEGPLYQRAPQGPPEPTKYVERNDTNYLTGKISLLWGQFNKKLHYNYCIPIIVIIIIEFY